MQNEIKIGLNPTECLLILFSMNLFTYKVHTEVKFSLYILL